MTVALCYTILLSVCFTNYLQTFQTSVSITGKSSNSQGFEHFTALEQENLLSLLLLPYSSKAKKKLSRWHTHDADLVCCAAGTELDQARLVLNALASASPRFAPAPLDLKRADPGFPSTPTPPPEACWDTASACAGTSRRCPYPACRAATGGRAERGGERERGEVRD
jgi:hypothetical protein